MNLQITKTILLHTVGSIYETVTCQSHAQRLIRRKISNFVRGESRRSWEGKIVSKPSAEECERLNRESARSI